ncbi:efflux RND transporter periplasmic adaptor subunit [Nitrosococcus oceani]|uniref:Secretion protein HlyD n=2 Tax=Nitrosococcus oceani TaxID=1229 RepID=Q3JB88_NITOC|nr:efflux RND transporter periplasmic adaptor subunit [Nitrosococcus oceani]KFI19636.1 hemolysin D [Nitrosococcus oceani C-27]ABA57908.1 Secretion protein HlyD [Nitrosococcus oceani ATCC 19707]EDZ67323.1 auxiliary transport protein, MFP family, putative [Nitrosococcus oceani AFC27]KFI22500.1 hemolysin D [Nitrosococcus oceani]GEM19551.1 hemolysin D [Nitrosococcus oceani]
MKNKTLLTVLSIIGMGLLLGWFILQMKTPSVNEKSTPSANQQAQTKTNSPGEKYIVLTPKAQQKAGIKVRAAGPAQIKTTLELPGEIQFNENRVAHVVPRVEGVITAAYKHLGAPVEKGELIAVLESRELADLKSQYYTAIKQRELAQITFAREARLWRERVSAEQDYLAAKTALAEADITVTAAAQRLLALGLTQESLDTIPKEGQSNLSRYPIRAPFNGRVVRKHVVRGEAVKADAELFMIADLSTVWGTITVYTEDLKQIHLGQKVTVKSEELGLEATGTIFYLGYLIDAQTRSTQAHVDIPNSEERWRPGLFVTVEVAEKKISVPVAVAAEAIQTYRSQPVVFVQHRNGFKARPITLGRRSGQWIEVVTGLSAGERYAADNSFVLKSELGEAMAPP